VCSFQGNYSYGNNLSGYCSSPFPSGPFYQSNCNGYFYTNNSCTAAFTGVVNVGGTLREYSAGQLQGTVICPSVTPTVTPTITTSPSVTPTVTPTITTSQSVTPTVTPTRTVTPTVTPTSGTVGGGGSFDFRFGLSASPTPSIRYSPSPTPTRSIMPSFRVSSTIY
jgi:hypothetical protein